ncbi:MAG TPA: NADH-quinone oxidoreductase subunit C [Syntrophales bacterium]|nr:NADH-quinone oxidoreductase subunit C [Syntrophales bacterium]
MDRCMAGDLLKGKFPEAILNIEEFRRETSITVDPGKIREVMAFLKESEGLFYDLLLDLAGVDFEGCSPRFMIAYLLHSTKFNKKLRIKARVAEGVPMDTVSDIWKSADWMEREVYDMFGIKFNNHPDLKRILLTDDFVGHPLRKDFPVEGPDFGQPFNVCLEEER